MAEIIESRKIQLLRCIPDVFDYKSLLYIGASPARTEMIPEFKEADYEITIIEIWEKNALALRKRGFNVLIGDVRHIRQYIEGKFDVVMWWHGPEHIKQEELMLTFQSLERIASKIVILASPWGLYEQGMINGNPHEEHPTSIYPETLKDLGYETDTIGQADRKGSNLLAWKRTGDSRGIIDYQKYFKA